jgi:Tol biopolymer transport system component
MTLRRWIPAWAAVLGTLTLIGVADTSWAAVTTTRVSVSTAGAETRAHGSLHPSITGDGQFVVFDSAAGHLVPGDTNRQLDVFVRDLTRHTTRRVSLTDTDQQVNEGSSNGQISADGRFVGFQTGATNLLPGGRPDENGQDTDVFVRDLERGTTRLVSRNQHGHQGHRGSTLWDISGTGRYVLFATASRNFAPLNKVPRPIVAQALFLRDRKAKRTVWVPGSVSTFFTFGIREAQVSDNGRYVAFSLATRGMRRHLLVDLATGRKTHLTCTAVPCTAVEVDDLSPSGRFVTMTTFTNAGPRHIVLYDARTRTQSLVSVDANGVSGNGLSMASAVSARGRFVVYASLSTNLVPGDTNNAWDVFRLDRSTGAVSRVDLTAAGGQIPRGIGAPLDVPLPCQMDSLRDKAHVVLAISRDGSVVGFGSDDGSVVPADTNGVCDVFARGDGL